ncbi:MAG: FkbM family methyltransferase [Halorubrum sp.]
MTHRIRGVAVDVPVGEYWQYQRFRWMHPELKLFEELVESLEPGDVFYDVGAHLGWHSVVAASVDSGVEVVAFEPHPAVADRLETTLRATSHEVDCRRTALLDENGTVAFTGAPDPAAHVSGVYGSEETNTIQVDAAAGDTLVADGEIQPPDIVKIDAEGAEAAVLRGLQTTIREHRPRSIYCEVHTDAPAIREILDDLGYVYQPLASARPILRAVPESDPS